MLKGIETGDPAEIKDLDQTEANRAIVSEFELREERGGVSAVTTQPHGSQ